LLFLFYYGLKIIYISKKLLIKLTFTYR